MKYAAYRMRTYKPKPLLLCCDGKRRKLIDYERHLNRAHGVNKKRTCPWCCRPFSSEKEGIKANLQHLGACVTELEGLLTEYPARVEDSYITLRCCGEEYSAKDYVVHFREVHSKSACPWCGEEADKKLGFIPLVHLFACLSGRERHNRDLKDRFDFGATAGPSVEKKVAPCQVCISFDSREKRFQLLERERFENTPSFYESFGEMPPSLRDTVEGASNVRFDESSGLGEDTWTYVRLFVTHKDWQWIHYFVKEFAFESFKEAFGDVEHIFLLPYWCLCDGGGNHHRHGIIVVTSPNPAYFADAWKKVCGQKKNKKHQNCKYHKKIKTANHLCNAITYLGGERSVCEWVEKKGKGASREVRRNHHYYFSRPMSPHAPLYLHMCYEDGLRDYLWALHGNRNLCKALSLFKMVKSGYTRDLTVRLGDFPPRKPIEGCAIPLAEDLDTRGGEEIKWLSPDSVMRVEEPHGDKRDYFESKISSGDSYCDCLNNFQYKLSRTQRRFARHLVEYKRWLDQTEDVVIVPCRPEDKVGLERMFAVAYENYKFQNQRLNSEVVQLRGENESLRREVVRERDFQKELREISKENGIREGQHRKELRKQRERFALKSKYCEEEHKKEIREQRESLVTEWWGRLQEKNAYIRRLRDSTNTQVRELRERLEARDLEIRQLRDSTNTQIRELWERLEARDLEIKNCLVARYEDAVRERMEPKFYHKQAMESVKEHGVETMRLMEEKMGLKDQIRIFMQRIVDHLCNFNPLKRRRLSEPSSDVSPPV